MKCNLALRHFLAAIVLSWCAGATAQQNRALILDQCPTKPPAVQTEGLLALFIPELISLGVDLAATALSEAAKAKVASSYYESLPFDYYALSSSGTLSRSTSNGCLVIVNGGEVAGNVPAWLDNANARTTLPWLKSNPNLYIEIELRERQNNLGMLLLPRLISVAKAQVAGGWWSRDDRGIVVAISLKDASSLESFAAAAFSFVGIEEGTPYTSRGEPGTRRLADWPLPLAVSKFPDTDEVTEAVSAQKSTIAPDREANTHLRRSVSPALPRREPVAGTGEFKKALKDMCDEIKAWNGSKVPPTLKDERCPETVFEARRILAQQEEEQAAKLALAWARAYLTAVCKTDSRVVDDPKLKNPDGTKLQLCKLPEPASSSVGLAQVSVTVTETAEPNKFVQSLASAFNAKKGDLKTALNDRLNPERRDELAAQKTSSEREARDQYEIAVLKVRQLEAELSEASDKPGSAQLSIQIQLTQAKLDANKAARKAGKAIPYPDLS